MNASFKKIIAGGLAALMIGAAVAASSTPASAFWPHHHHFGPGPFIGGLVGALAFGAIAAAAGSGEGDCYTKNQRVYDDFGNFMGYREVEVCN